jgi:hypothetical protein
MPRREGRWTTYHASRVARKDVRADDALITANSRKGWLELRGEADRAALRDVHNDALRTRRRDGLATLAARVIILAVRV